RSTEPLFLHPFLQSTGSACTRCAQQVVAAAMPRTARRSSCAAHLLPHSRKRIILCKESDDRFSLSPLGKKRRLKSGDSPAERKSLFLKERCQSAGGLHLLLRDLRMSENIIRCLLHLFLNFRSHKTDSPLQ